MSEICFLCLEGGDLIYTCKPNTCHNLKAHEQCIRDHISVNPICTICKVKYVISPALPAVEQLVIENDEQSKVRCKVVCRVCLLSASTLISGMVSIAAFYATMLVRESEFFGFAICIFLVSIVLTLMNFLALSGAWKQLSQS